MCLVFIMFHGFTIFVPGLEKERESEAERVLETERESDRQTYPGCAMGHEHLGRSAAVRACSLLRTAGEVQHGARHFRDAAWREVRCDIPRGGTPSRRQLTAALPMVLHFRRRGFAAGLGRTVGRPGGVCAPAHALCRFELAGDIVSHLEMSVVSPERGSALQWPRSVAAM